MIKKIKRPLILFLIILFGWGFYRYFFSLTDWVDELLFKPLIWLTPTILMVKMVEKQTLASIGLRKKNFVKNIAIGILFGVFISGEVILTKRFKFGSVIFNPDNLATFSVFQIGGISLATGFIEEAVFRGYIMVRLWQALKNELLANLLSTFLFVIIHFPLIFFRLKYSWYDSFSYGMVLFVSGAADAFIFGRTKTLVAPTLTHALWNFSDMMFK